MTINVRKHEQKILIVMDESDAKLLQNRLGREQIVWQTNSHIFARMYNSLCNFFEDNM